MSLNKSTLIEDQQYIHSFDSHNPFICVLCLLIPDSHLMVLKDKPRHTKIFKGLFEHFYQFELGSAKPEVL